MLKNDKLEHLWHLFISLYRNIVFLLYIENATCNHANLHYIKMLDVRQLALWRYLYSGKWIQITFDMATNYQALAYTWSFLHRFEDNLDRFHFMKENFASEGHWRYWSTKLVQNSYFCNFELWFLDIKNKKLWILIFQIILKTDLDLSYWLTVF